MLVFAATASSVKISMPFYRTTIHERENGKYMGKPKTTILKE